VRRAALRATVSVGSGLDRADGVHQPNPHLLLTGSPRAGARFRPASDGGAGRPRSRNAGR
jgi:hypothetical protein